MKSKATKKAKPATAKAPNPIDNILHQENLALLADKATLTSECAMLRSKVLSLQSDLDKINDENLMALATARSLQSELDRFRAKEHKKPGHCKHCGKDKVSHWFYDNRCKPGGGGRVFEEAK